MNHVAVSAVRSGCSGMALWQIAMVLAVGFADDSTELVSASTTMFVGGGFELAWKAMSMNRHRPDSTAALKLYAAGENE